MDAKVDERAASRQRLVREPGAKPRNAGAAHPECTGVIDVAEVASLDLRLDELDVLAAAAVEDDTKHALGAMRGVDHVLRFRCGRRQRLFHHHVFAGIERGNGDGEVEDVRHGDGDGVNVGVGQQVLVVAVDAGYLERCGQVPTALFVEPGDGNDFNPGILRKPLEMQHSHATADNTNPKLSGLSHAATPSHVHCRRRTSGALQARTWSPTLYLSVINVTSGGQNMRTGGLNTPIPRDV